MSDKHVTGHPGCDLTRQAREAVERAVREGRQLTPEERELVEKARLR